MKKYLNKIPKTNWTLWERAYNKKRPSHFYVIRSEWTETERDFMAYWNGRKQDLLDELGHPSAKPIVDINRWMDRIVRDGDDTKNMTKEQWFEYDVATLETYEKLPWADMETLKECGVEYHYKYDNAYSTAWEALSQDERDKVREMTDDDKSAREDFEALTPAEKEELGKGSYTSTRTHVDGRTVDEKGNTVGRWKELDGDLLDKVVKWAAEQPGTDHEDRWLRAAAGMGLDNGYKPMTSVEASEHAVTYWAKRWDPVARAIRDVEIGFKNDSNTVDAELEETLKILNERPDVEVRKYNPETNTLDVLSPIDAAFKTEQDAYAEEVKRFQAERDAGNENAQQGFDEWKRLQTPEGKIFKYNGVYVEDTRSGCYIPFDKVSKRRSELTDSNVRYRLDCERPDGIKQISWLALNYEGCLCWLPKNTETTTRMVLAEEIQGLLASGLALLTQEEYNNNQKIKGAKEDKFESFRLWLQYDPQGNPLGVCPTQRDSSDGKWKHNASLFANLKGENPERQVLVPDAMAAAIERGDWALVAKLAQEKV